MSQDASGEKYEKCVIIIHTNPKPIQLNAFVGITTIRFYRSVDFYSRYYNDCPVFLPKAIVAVF